MSGEFEKTESQPHCSASEGAIIFHDPLKASFSLFHSAGFMYQPTGASICLWTWPYMGRNAIVCMCVCALDKPLRTSPLTRPRESLCNFPKSNLSNFVCMCACVCMCMCVCVICLRAAILLLSVRAEFQRCDYVKG